MNTKTMLSASLILVLASCSKDQAPEPTAVETPSTPPVSAPSVSSVPDTPGEGSKTPYVAFETMAACVDSGWGSDQCNRAWSTSDAMARVDAPKYPGQAACQVEWKVCQSAEDGEWSPAMAAFVISGEEKGGAAPTAADPSFYVPVFITQEGQWVHVTGTPENPVRVEIDPSKVVKAKSDKSASAAQPVSG